MDEKLYCHVCKEFKETSQFSPCKKAKLRNGKSYVCKQCQALAQRQRREKQKDIDLLDCMMLRIELSLKINTMILIQNFYINCGISRKVNVL